MYMILIILPQLQLQLTSNCSSSLSVEFIILWSSRLVEVEDLVQVGFVELSYTFWQLLDVNMPALLTLLCHSKTPSLPLVSYVVLLLELFNDAWNDTYLSDILLLPWPTEYIDNIWCAKLRHAVYPNSTPRARYLLFEKVLSRNA